MPTLVLMGAEKKTRVIGYAAYCGRDLRMEAPTLEELASAAFDVTWGSGPNRAPLLFQTCTEAGERDLTLDEDRAFEREKRIWLRERYGYTDRYDSSGRPKGPSRDP